MNLGITQSFSKGVEIGNGTTISSSKSSSNSLSFNFSKSKSTVTADPILSTQLSSSNGLQAQWSYNVNSISPAGTVTYTIDSYLLFEIKMTNIMLNNMHLL